VLSCSIKENQIFVDPLSEPLFPLKISKIVELSTEDGGEPSNRDNNYLLPQPEGSDCCKNTSIQWMRDEGQETKGTQHVHIGSTSNDLLPFGATGGHFSLHFPF
jgi:hypothetical protein